MKTCLMACWVLVGMFGELLARAAESSALAKPNVVYIMADDLGWGDLSLHGGGVSTPNIDRLFKRGVELRNFMGWCVCVARSTCSRR